MEGAGEGEKETFLLHPTRDTGKTRKKIMQVLLRPSVRGGGKRRKLLLNSDKRREGSLFFSSSVEGGNFLEKGGKDHLYLIYSH